MCHSVCFGILEIAEVGELQQWFEVLPEDFDDSRVSKMADGCLCATDVDAVLQRAGLRYHMDVFGDFIIDSNPPSRFLFGDRLR